MNKYKYIGQWSDKYRTLWYKCLPAEELPTEFLEIIVNTDEYKDTRNYLPTKGHLGCFELDLATRVKQPRYHLFGHIHNGYGVYTLGDMVRINSSICTEAYNPVNEPHVMEVCTL